MGHPGGLHKKAPGLVARAAYLVTTFGFHAATIDSGMTLATEIGFRLAAAERRIGAAGLGAAYASDALLEVARGVTTPIQFLLPWDDPEIDRESGLELFDAIGSAEKSLHAFPGPHQSVPSYEAEDSARFLARHLMPAA